MILGERLLFLHVPKTGGMALTRYLLDILPRPVWYSHPNPGATPHEGVTQIEGLRHETLREAFALAARLGIDPERLPLVFGVIRNPYELEVSRFAYLQKGHPWDAGPNQALALAGDFTAFATGSTDHGGHERPIHSYFEIDGRIPANLRILRHESLATDLPRVLREAGIDVPAKAAMPVVNASRHGTWREYYTRAAAAKVNERYRWIFDHGYYEPIDPSTLPEHVPTPFHGIELPCGGTVRQNGCATGVWTDRWMASRVTVPLVAAAQTAAIVVRGRAPHRFEGGLRLDVEGKGTVVRAHVTDESPFATRLPVALGRGDRIHLVIEASASFCPAAGGGRDTRHLSWVLAGIDGQTRP